MTNPARDANRVHYVYRLYDADGVCLYVGCTVDLFTRLNHHGKRFGDKIARQEITSHPTMTEGLQVERDEIRRLRPRRNIVGRGPHRNWTQCDYFEVLEHFAGTDADASHAWESVTFCEVLAEFRLHFPDTAAATLPALGIAS